MEDREVIRMVNIHSEIRAFERRLRAISARRKKRGKRKV